MFHKPKPFVSVEKTNTVIRVCGIDLQEFSISFPPVIYKPDRKTDALKTL